MSIEKELGKSKATTFGWRLEKKKNFFFFWSESGVRSRFCKKIMCLWYLLFANQASPCELCGKSGFSNVQRLPCDHCLSWRSSLPPGGRRGFLPFQARNQFNSEPPHSCGSLSLTLLLPSLIWLFCSSSEFFFLLCLLVERVCDLTRRLGLVCLKFE